MNISDTPPMVVVAVILISTYLVSVVIRASQNRQQQQLADAAARKEDRRAEQLWERALRKVPKEHRYRFRNPWNCVIFPRIIVCVRGHQIRIGLQDAYRSEESIYDARLGIPLLVASIDRGAFSLVYTVGEGIRDDNTDEIRKILTGVFSQYPKHPIVIIDKRNMVRPEEPLLPIDWP
ncbi:MAG: hypothetical protein WCO79_01055 [bacterium]